MQLSQFGKGLLGSILCAGVISTVIILFQLVL